MKLRPAEVLITELHVARGGKTKKTEFSEGWLPKAGFILQDSKFEGKTEQKTDSVIKS